MHVAVTDVAEQDDTRPGAVVAQRRGHHRAYRAGKVRQVVQGEGHVQLVGHTERRDGLCVALAVSPKTVPAAGVVANRDVAHALGALEGFCHQHGRILAPRRLDKQPGPGARVGRRCQAADLPHKAHAVGEDELEGVDAVHATPQPVRERHRQLGHGAGARFAKCDQGGDPEAGERDEMEGDLGHDPERPLAAGDDLGEVVADVVLHQSRQPGRDGAVREHDLYPAQAGAHRAVPYDVHAASIGGHHAPERGRVACRDVDADLGIDSPRIAMGRGEGGAGLGDEEALLGVTADELVEPAQAEQYLATSWDRAADQSRVAPLGDDVDSETVAGGEDLRHLARVRRPHDDKGRAAEAARPVKLVGRLEIGVAQKVRRPDDVAQGLRQTRWRLRVRGHGAIFSPRCYPTG